MKQRNEYDDIIDLPHHVSTKRPQMPLGDRAAQFSPFSALSGYDDAVREAGRHTDSKKDLGEEEKEKPDKKLQYLSEKSDEHPSLTVTCFIRDAKKPGGAYAEKSGILKNINECERYLLLTDGTRIPLDDIKDIESVSFRDMF